MLDELDYAEQRITNKKKTVEILIQPFFFITLETLNFIVTY